MKHNCKGKENRQWQILYCQKMEMKKNQYCPDCGYMYDIHEQQGWEKVGERMYKLPGLDDTVWLMREKEKRDHLHILRMLAESIDISLALNRQENKSINIQVDLIRKEIDLMEEENVCKTETE